MGYSFRIFVSTICIALLGVSSSSVAYIYVVKPHDKLSKIIGFYIPGPVWGKNGSFTKILAQNPHIKNVNKILPGEKIFLTAEQAEAIGMATNTAVACEDHSRKIASVNESTVDDSDTSLELIPFTSMTSLNATDLSTGAHAVISSNIFAGLDARFLQHWNEAIKTYFKAKLSYISFEKPNSNTKTLEDSNKFLTTFGMGETTKVTDRFNIGVSAEIEKNLFIRAVSSSSITVDSVLTPTIGAKISYDLIKLNAFSLNASGLCEYKLPAKTDGYETKSGVSYEGIMSVKQTINGEDKYEVSFGASTRPQNTTLTDQTETAYTMSLRFLFPLRRHEK